MTRGRLEIAIKEGIPFIIKMADGGKYKVSNPYQIALGKTYAMVADRQDLFHMLPLNTMTGISYRKPPSKSNP